MYLAPQNIPRAVSVLTLGNKVILYFLLQRFKDHSTGLTAFVLIALLENADIPATQVRSVELLAGRVKMYRTCTDKQFCIFFHRFRINHLFVHCFRKSHFFCQNILHSFSWPIDETNILDLCLFWSLYNSNVAKLALNGTIQKQNVYNIT